MNIQMIPLNVLVPSPGQCAQDRGQASASTNLPPASRRTACCRICRFAPAATASSSHRRSAAPRRLKLLAKPRSMAKDVAVGCNVLQRRGRAEISLAENEMRRSTCTPPTSSKRSGKWSMPAAASRTWRRGSASRCCWSRSASSSRAVSPRLMKLYRDEGLTLEQLMAFTVADDHAAQEAAWFDAPDYRPQPARHSPPPDRRAWWSASNRRAVFVGPRCLPGGRRTHHRPVSERGRRLSGRCRVARPAVRRAAGTGSRGDPRRRLEVGRDHARSIVRSVARLWTAARQAAANARQTGEGAGQGGGRAGARWPPRKNSRTRKPKSSKR